MDVATFADQLFFVTAYLEGSDGQAEWSGTGFIYAVHTDKGVVHCLVSNKHVLERAQDLKVRMVRGDGSGGPVMGQATEVTLGGAAAMVVGHPDPAVDVAVMPMSPVLEHMARLDAPAFFKSVGPDLALTDEKAADLDSVEEILFVGYPNGLFDRTHYTPIARRGTTATPVQLNYCGEPAFLVDATVFPGSSGSPVCLNNTGTYQSRDGGVVVGARVLFLGVLAAVHTAQVGGTLTAQLPAEQTVSVDTPIGLGIVYKFTAVETCVDALLSAHGVARVPPPAAG